MAITREESRAVLSQQRSVIADIDSKAMYTVRVVVIIVGVVVAAARFGGPGLFRGALLAGGLGLLLLSMVLGVLTYAESDLFLGPNQSYIRQLVDDGGQGDRWEDELCLRMGDWIHENHDSLEVNARLLLLAQLSLIGGVSLLVAAVAL